MRTNVLPERPPTFTHEGGPGRAFSPKQELERAVLTCLLFEDAFYESGAALANRIAELVKTNRPADVAALAIRARTDYHLRHVPLFLARELSKQKNGVVADLLPAIIQRPDELGEFITLYWKEGKRPLAAAVKRGLAAAFGKFEEYALAKWDTNSAAVKLRDVMRLVHPKPRDESQSALWKKLIAGELETPDTWETALSAGGDKKQTFERLIREKKLGGLALLRNLRNCVQACVDSDLLQNAIETHAFERVLPFRFIAAAAAAPALEPWLDRAMQRAGQTLPRLGGKTALLIDVSGSMDQPLSAKSDMTRMQAACALAILASFASEQFMVATFSEGYVEVPPRQGMALRDAIIQSQPHTGTYLGRALEVAYSRPGMFNAADRVLVFTDEQVHDAMPQLIGGSQHRYLINVAGYKNGTQDGGGWHRIHGFSERIFDYIAAYEAQQHAA